MEVTEKELAAAAKAPRVSKADVEKAIREGKVTYTVLPNGRTTICQIDLFGGLFSVEGSSACVSKENFNPTFGENFAYAKAEDKVWEVLGAILAWRLSKEPTNFIDRLRVEIQEVGDRLAKLDPFLGSEAFFKLSSVDQRDLTAQHVAMTEYHWFLQKRLKRATTGATPVLGH